MRRDMGLTLAEVLVAMVIAAIAISMFVYFADALRLTRVSKQETAAATYMRNHLDYLRNAWRIYENYDDLSYALPVEANVPTGFTATVTVNHEEVNAGPLPIAPASANLRTVTIRLEDDQGRIYQMSTQISRPLIPADMVGN